MKSSTKSILTVAAIGYFGALLFRPKNPKTPTPEPETPITQ